MKRYIITANCSIVGEIPTFYFGKTETEALNKFRSDVRGILKFVSIKEDEFYKPYKPFSVKDWVKKLLLIALLLPVVAMAQQVKPSELEKWQKRYNTKGVLTNLKPDSAGTAVWAGGNITGFYSIKPPTHTTFMIVRSAKPAMSVIRTDSTGVVTVTIDRKQITWTSDSTFTIRTRD